jgi:predicted transcriptional regulator
MIQKVSNLISDFNEDKVACFFGREAGRHFFMVVEHLLRNVPDNVTTYLSFEGVSFDYTFADEALVKLASHIEKGAFSFK